jgi:hypothetical protein
LLYKYSIFSAKSSGLPFSKSRPVLSSSTRLFILPKLEAITGVPVEKDSMIVTGKLSKHIDGNTNAIDDDIALIVS